MFAVGVNVSNARSAIAVLQSKMKIAVKPFEVQHTSDGFAVLTKKAGRSGRRGANRHGAYGKVLPKFLKSGNMQQDCFWIFQNNSTNIE